MTGLDSSSLQSVFTEARKPIKMIKIVIGFHASRIMLKIDRTCFSITFFEPIIYHGV